MLRFTLLLCLASGCERTVVEHLEGNAGTVNITLNNPTSCSSCDPWADVDSVRVDVLANDVVVASDTFDYPSSDVVIPDLDSFGVVRVVLVGLSHGEVVSAGRTALLASGPGVALDASMNFLPVNAVLPLTGSMVAPRSLHTSIALRDGRTLLVGGISPGRDLAYEGVELFDERTGQFGTANYQLAGAAFAPATLYAEEGEVLFIGGGATQGAAIVGSVESTLLKQEDGLATLVGRMTVGRVGHCVSHFANRQAAVFGGHTGDPSLEYLKRSAEGEWSFTNVPLYVFDDTHVSGCVTLSDGRTFLQGTDAASTGIWLYNEESAPYLEPYDAFDLVNPGNAGEAASYVTGPSLVALDDGDVWVGGGARADNGLLEKEARRFNVVGLKFEVASAQPERSRVDGALRDWIQPGWMAWGCGFTDSARSVPEPTVELFNVETGELGMVAGMDRIRDGCDVATLPDGELLVSGGYELDDASAVSAAIVVPWRDGE